MKLVILLLFIFAYSESKSQKLEILSTDTIRLDSFKVKQIVAYKIRYVTFYFSLEDCMNEFKFFWSIYEERINEMLQLKKKGKYKGKKVDKRVIGMDSVYNLLCNKYNMDTIHISQELFDWAGLRGFDIGKQIDSGQCAIVDNRNKQHFQIIREKITWYRGQLAAWGGRRYFLHGFEKHFYIEMDWIT